MTSTRAVGDDLRARRGRGRTHAKPVRWKSGFVWALALLGAQAMAAKHARADVTTIKQLASQGHVLGFDDGGYSVSNGSYALRVRFAGAQVALPQASQGDAIGDAASPSFAKAESEVSVPALRQVRYEQLWPGVGVTYDVPDTGIVRSTWSVAPGAKPEAIRIRYNGALEVTESGELSIALENGTMSESRPVAWQDIDGKRQPVEVSFVQLDAESVGFRVGRYRSDLPLTIDPTLSWNTFLGRSGTDTALAITLDAAGNAYVCGYSDLSWGVPLRAFTAGTDAFVAKLGANGALLWHTFLGGAGSDICSAITLDSTYVYVAGYSSASWGAPVQPFVAALDTFSARLDFNGVYAGNTFIGGIGGDVGTGIAADGSGNVYLTGHSTSSWGTPVRAYSSLADAFVAKVDASGFVVWNTFLGSAGDDRGYAIAIDGSANVYVAGPSGGTWGSPVRAFSGGSDAFAAKLDSAGALIWNTFLGSSSGELGYAIAVDASANVYVAGESGGTWGSPVRAFSAGNDAFAAKLDSSGALQWNTFLGGGGGDTGYGIATDASSNVYVVGLSPTTWGTPWRAYTAILDGFVAKLSATNGALGWNTFLGGNNSDGGYAIAVGSSNNVVVAGSSFSSWGAPVRAYFGGEDAFVAAISDPPPPATDTPTITATATQTATQTGTATPTSTPTQTPTATATDIPTVAPSSTPSATPSATPSTTMTASVTPTATASSTPTATASRTATATPTATATASPSATASSTPNNTMTPTATSSSTVSSTPSATPTHTAPSATPTWTTTVSSSATPSSTPTQTWTALPTSTVTVTDTPVVTPSDTPSATPSPTATGAAATASATPSATPTPTPTAFATATPACASGIVIQHPKLKTAADVFTLRHGGRAVLPLPWIGIDPLTNGVRLLVEDSGGAGGGFDLVVAGGAFDGTRGWKVNASGTRWKYSDASGAAGGVTKIVVQDQSQKQPGLLRWTIKATGGSVVEPSPNNVRTTIWLGTANECAVVDWNPPGGVAPRCNGDTAKLKCR